MVANRIEREILILAPQQVVWSIVTEPEHIGGWLSQSATVDLRPGGELVLGFGKIGTARGTIERVEPPREFAFRWVTPEPDRDPSANAANFTLVEFFLEPDGDGTRLRVVESGFGGLDGTERENAELASRHQGGWGAFLDRLAEYVSSVDAPA